MSFINYTRLRQLFANFNLLEFATLSRKVVNILEAIIIEVRVTNYKICIKGAWLLCILSTYLKEYSEN